MRVAMVYALAFMTIWEPAQAMECALLWRGSARARLGSLGKTALSNARWTLWGVCAEATALAYPIRTALVAVTTGGT